LRDLAVSPAARSLMEAALRRAEIVVTPVSSVAINGTDVVGWWEINPHTCVVIDRLEDGRSGADFFLLSPMGGWARLVANLVKYSKHISCVGNAVGFSCALAAMIVAYGTPAFAALIIPTAAAGARAVGSCAGVG